MPKQTYDPELRKSEHGSRLYQTWKRIRQHPHVEEWDQFPPFYTWSTENGYAVGARLRLCNRLEPYAPDNCVWYIAGCGEDDPTPPSSWVEKWNRSVNRIRKHCGMEPLEGTDYGDL